CRPPERMLPLTRFAPTRSAKPTPKTSQDPLARPAKPARRKLPVKYAPFSFFLAPIQTSNLCSWFGVQTPLRIQRQNWENAEVGYPGLELRVSPRRARLP